MKLSSFVSLFLLCFSLSKVSGTSTCPNGNGVDCHPSSGASQSNCEAKGCVWCELSVPGPWCQFKQSQDLCPNGDHQDCHPSPGATQSNCEAKGCVWCENYPGPWCQYNKNGPTPPPTSTPITGGAVRVDCHPDAGASQGTCTSRGCLWSEPADHNKNAPWCIFDPNSPSTMAGYDATNLDQFSSGATATLIRRTGPTITGSIVMKLNLQVKYESSSIIHVTFSPSSLDESGSSTGEDINLDYQFAVKVQEQPFGLAVTRSSTGTVIFDTRNIPGPIIENQYLAINTLVPTTNIYGFGEQTHKDLRHDVGYTKLPMFSRDHGIYGFNFNLYGTHPFYMVIESDGSTHGVHFINSHAQRATIKPNPAIEYETIGGNLEFRIFLGPTPAQVVQQYLSTVGTPMLPPYWSLGFHLCRYGYTDLNNVKTVHGRMVKSGIPYDTQWVDIDYMDGFRDFTYDHNKWNGLPQFAQQLHGEHRQFVTILDPCIKSGDPNYAALQQGIQQNVFFKTGGQIYQGSVWPGCCYFPDFTCSQTKNWWKYWVTNWHQTAGVDGLWIDMNEPSNAFCNTNPGSTNRGYGYPSCSSCTKCQSNQWNTPPVIPIPDTYINVVTVCMDTKACNNNLQYSEHTKYGHYEAIATNEALQNAMPGKRPFILSRSTAPGSGKYTFHWTGDNNSDWPNMQYSITTTIEFGWFGIPFTGADICGFNSQSNQELCLRWTQLGAFYPFMRNHNSINQNPQDPAIWDYQTQQYMKQAMLTRYQLLPHLYTLLYQSTKGATVMNAMFYNFPSDANTRGIKDQFMWGKTLMIVPVITQGQTQRNAYFPSGNWYDFSKGCKTQSSGQTQSLQIPLSTIGLFVYGGSIIPWQKPSTTTYQSRQNPMGLLVALDQNHKAAGDLYWDDGITLGGSYLLFHLNVSSEVLPRKSGILHIYRLKNDYRGADSLSWTTVTLYGLYSQPTSITINGQPFQGSESYDSTCNVLLHGGLSENLLVLFQTLHLTGLTIPFASGSRNVQTIEWFY